MNAKQDITIVEWVSRVQDWLFHYTTIREWNLVDARHYYNQGQSAEDYAKFLIQATA